MREQGHEYGTTTGRARRCGWFDGMIMKKTAMINGLTEIAITKLDVLSGLKEIKLCTGYTIDGKKVDQVPSSGWELKKVKPIYETYPGWKEDITAIRKFDDLPKNAKNYILELEKYVGVKVSMVSVGPDRVQTIIR
jgi:adenylosuccinate synthase